MRTAMLSTMLMRLFIKRGGTIIQSHEDDATDDDNVDLPEFQKCGFANRSVPGWM